MPDEQKIPKRVEEKKELSLEDRKKKNRKILLIIIGSFILLLLCCNWGIEGDEKKVEEKSESLEVAEKEEKESVVVEELEVEEKEEEEEGVLIIEDISLLIEKKPFEVYDIMVSKYGDSFPKDIKKQAKTSYENSSGEINSRVFAGWYIKDNNYEVDLQLSFKGDNSYLKSIDTGDFVIHYEDLTTPNITEDMIPDYLEMFGLEEGSRSYTLKIDTLRNFLFIDVFLE